ncbi:LysR family transcriptional regulator [Halocella sp. SP3-1]|uniref:LysR family transcriptional regulator n=1 Tax=Halocella sp. SP3-1 TaxID=2382161 RepID=UPI000F75F202|nr:LysR family transcriptional regulator [Halocella sp. SP3-1]AZO96242.1 LysR family transcriptional regulator [Halocella sp. SP3-1]
MEISDLKYFTMLCEHKNFTKTAKELYISQQALSRIIANIEKEIGAPLFHRNSRGVTLTELSKYLYPEAKTLLNNFNEFLNNIEEKVKKEQRELKVGFSPGTLQILDSKEVLENCREYLGIEINISEFSDVSCEKNVQEGNIDMAFTVNPRNDEDFSFFALTRDNFAAVINKKNSLAKKNDIKFSDLKNEKLILLDDTFRMQLVLREEFKKAGFLPEIYSRCSHDLNIAYDFVNLNKGIFIFVENLIHIENYKHILSIPLDTSSAFWEIGVLVKKDIKMNNLMKKFINYFLSKYQKKLLD